MINWSTTDIAGIEFGDSHIAAARLKGKAKGGLVLTHAGCVEYDSTSTPKAIAESVKTLWKKARMPTRTVCASLRSASLVMRHFRLPVMTAPELKRALQLKAEEALQLSIGEIVFEWHVNKVTAEAGVKSVTGLLVATPLCDVERELDVLYSAGLDPVILDLRALAVANLYQALGGEKDDASFCLVNMSSHAAEVMVRRASGELYPHAIYCRASTWAESPLFLAENIRDVSRYSEFKLGWEAVPRVVLTGAIPKDGVFVSALKAALQMDVECWNPLSGIAMKSREVMALLSCEPSPEGLLAPALGLALRRN